MKEKLVLIDNGIAGIRILEELLKLAPIYGGRTAAKPSMNEISHARRKYLPLT